MLESSNNFGLSLALHFLRMSIEPDKVEACDDQAVPTMDVAAIVVEARAQHNDDLFTPAAVCRSMECTFAEVIKGTKNLVDVEDAIAEGANVNASQDPACFD